MSSLLFLLLLLVLSEVFNLLPTHPIVVSPRLLYMGHLWGFNIGLSLLDLRPAAVQNSLESTLVDNASVSRIESKLVMLAEALGYAYCLAYVLTLISWPGEAYPANSYRDLDICNHWNGRRHFLELGERGELHARNVSTTAFRVSNFGRNVCLPFILFRSS